jgi:hypothetical protein
MSLSFRPFFHVLVLFYVQLHLYPLLHLSHLPCLLAIYVLVVDESQLRGHWFRPPLEWEYDWKILAWWENCGHGNRKCVEKIPVWWEISLRLR